MRSLERVLFFSMLAMALVAPACESVSVAPWPYTTATDDGGASDDGASDDGASDDASDQGATGAGGIEATYGGPVPVRCDGGFCDTDNYSSCSIAHSPGESRAGRALAALVVVAGVALARRRSRRKARRSS